MINETTMEMMSELIPELIPEMILEFTSDQAEIGDPDGCPLTTWILIKCINNVLG